MDKKTQFRKAPLTWVGHAGAAGGALFLGLFSLLNFLGELRSAGFDATAWWVDLRFLPEVVARTVLLSSGGCLIAFAIKTPRSAWRRAVTACCAGSLAVLCLTNSVQFYILFLRGQIQPGVPFPFSILVAMALLMILVQTIAPESMSGGKGRVGLAVGVAAICALLFPLAQMFFFGKTDYRRPADVAVVLGARAYADGRPSDALGDRVRTACELYHQGMVSKLLFSGGPGDGAVHETEAMRRMAVQLGVDQADILADTDGLNTQATVRNTVPVFSKLKISRVLVVSHFYHLPRVKLSYQRFNFQVYTVPARESYTLARIPFYLAREVAAVWAYYLRVPA